MLDSGDVPSATRESPVTLELLRLDTGSAVALVGHPIHVMMVHFPIAFVIATFGVDVFYWWSGDAFWVRVGVWSAGFTFWTGVAASIGRIMGFETPLVDAGAGLLQEIHAP